jgi:hypothetical protein
MDGHAAEQSWHDGGESGKYGSVRSTRVVFDGAADDMTTKRVMSSWKRARRFILVGVSGWR